MDSRTGDLYPSKRAALDAGVPEKDLVELLGEAHAVNRVARRVRMASRATNARRKARRQIERRSRRANRR